MSDSVEIEAQPPSGPQQTLYVHNINEKLKIDVLKKMLYMLFSQYGKVTQIVACKGVKMRGQVSRQSRSLSISLLSAFLLDDINLLCC